MLSNNKGYPWRFAIGGWVAFIVVTILFFIFDDNIYTIFGILTATIILTIGNVFMYFTQSGNQRGKIACFRFVLSFIALMNYRMMRFFISSGVHPTYELPNDLIFLPFRRSSAL
ncbi:hypothetical protein P5G51_001300 [Virgibacillus sp. 179-BFC.A HS]|uniref:Uncharacterized protein n=1 Tax=Tigheibacillus jepli TaxID=3035914 RepID=A0ABU5CDD7_9BACI|nr:hypothetical protein [Virgibacillus sp. 179-BFC.A HS]MDY0404225.1 hypothetical protein [Virgibacillus sp. 179-BFC.A HS]